MKACIIQPWYSTDPKDTERCFSEMLALIDQCDETMDLIVLPEYSDIPAAQSCKADFHAVMEKHNALIIEKARETAVRCNAVVFVNAGHLTPTGWRNTTHAIDRAGNVVGRYYKVHPAPSEVKTEAQGGNELDVGYSYEYAEPYVIEIEGVRYGFMTCYDFYFYEYFAKLALENVDVIIGCSHQRTDTHSTLSVINRFLSYNTNAYLVRSSVSMGEDSPICGGSTIVGPDGVALVDMESRIGIAAAEFDPKKRHLKPAGFRGRLKPHHEYIEEGRRPWLYRNGGSAIVPFEDIMGYPRICAHRGFSTVAPENTMPAFGAAIALNANEIEFDLWPTADGEIVSCHDSTLERVSTGTGKVYENTMADIAACDFGVKFDEKFKGLGAVRFEDILRKFGGQVIMNIHIKPLSMTDEYPRKAMEKIVSLIRRYDCARHVYFMLEPDIHIRQFREYAPDIPVCVGHNADRPWAIVDRAIELGAQKVQLFKPYLNQEMVDKAHEHGIICNVFYADDPDEAIRYIDMGIDTILTNDFLKVSQAVKAHLNP